TIRAVLAEILGVVLALLNQPVAAQQFAACESLGCRLFALKEDDTGCLILILAFAPFADATDIQFAVGLEERERVSFAQDDDVSILAHRQPGNLGMKDVERFECVQKHDLFLLLCIVVRLIPFWLVIVFRSDIHKGYRYIFTLALLGNK